jgi:hypothetical protein
MSATCGESSHVRGADGVLLLAHCRHDSERVEVLRHVGDRCLALSAYGHIIAAELSGEPLGRLIMASSPRPCRSAQAVNEPSRELGRFDRSELIVIAVRAPSTPAALVPRHSGN